MLRRKILDSIRKEKAKLTDPGSTLKVDGTEKDISAIVNATDDVIEEIVFSGGSGEIIKSSSSLNVSSSSSVNKSNVGTVDLKGVDLSRVPLSLQPPLLGNSAPLPKGTRAEILPG